MENATFKVDLWPWQTVRYDCCRIRSDYIALWVGHVDKLANMH